MKGPGDKATCICTCSTNVPVTISKCMQYMVYGLVLDVAKQVTGCSISIPSISQ